MIPANNAQETLEHHIPQHDFLDHNGGVDTGHNDEDYGEEGNEGGIDGTDEQYVEEGNGTSEHEIDGTDKECDKDSNDDDDNQDYDYDYNYDADDDDGNDDNDDVYDYYDIADEIEEQEELEATISCLQKITIQWFNVYDYDAEF